MFSVSVPYQIVAHWIYSFIRSLYCSLLTLSRVILALGTPNQTHINFRDSKLTRILQPSLSGNARMAVICCATPSELYLEETRSTLQFASRAKLVKTRAQRHEVHDCIYPGSRLNALASRGQLHGSPGFLAVQIGRRCAPNDRHTAVS